MRRLTVRWMSVMVYAGWVAVLCTAGTSEAADSPSPQARVDEQVAVIKDGAKPWRERCDAILALEGDKSVIPALVEVLAGRSQVVREAAMKALANMRPASVPPLMQALKDPARELAAVRTFRFMGADGISFLSQLLGDKNPAVRKHAVDELALLKGIEAAMSPLIGCLADKSPEVRGAAVKALANIGVPAARAVPDLVGIAVNENTPAGLRILAMDALVRIGGIGDPAAQDLVKIIMNAQTATEIRAATARALVRRRVPFAPALTALTGILADGKSDPDMRAWAAEMLGSVKGTPAPVLEQTLRDPTAGTVVRVATAAALGNFGNRAAPLLLEVLTDVDERVRWQAAIELGDMPVQTVPAVAAKLTDKNVLARRYAAFALGKMGAKATPAIPALTAALQDRQAVVRRNAAGALGAIGGKAKAAAPALAALLKDADPEVCVAAAQAMGALTTNATEWAKDIEGVLSGTKNVKLQWAAAYALDRIAGPRPMEVKRETLQVKSYVLNDYIPMLDGQWQGTLVASDGNCYFGAGSHWRDLGSAFFRYDPRKVELRLLCDDITKLCAEDPRFTPAQGKIHSPMVENDGWLYFGTHLSDYTEWGMRAYTGAHLIGYEIATGKFRDYGVIRSGFTNYSAVDLDPVRNKIYFLCVSFGHNYGSRIYRIDVKTGRKEDLGAITPGHSSGYSFFVDRRGDAWLTAQSKPPVDRYDTALFHVSGETGRITRWEGVAPLCTWRWSGRLPGSDLGLVVAADKLCKLWILDPATDRDAPGAFMPVKELVGAGLGTSMTKDRLYWGSGGGIRSLSLDPSTRPAVINHGALRDQNGRKCLGIWGLDVDREGRAMTVARWKLLPDEKGTLTEHRKRFCLVFAAADLSGDLARTARPSQPGQTPRPAQ